MVDRRGSWRTDGQLRLCLRTENAENSRCGFGAANRCMERRCVRVSCCYEDLNDYNQLRHDPVLALLSDRLRAPPALGIAVNLRETVSPHLRRFAPRGLAAPFPADADGRLGS